MQEYIHQTQNRFFPPIIFAVHAHQKFLALAWSKDSMMMMLMRVVMQGERKNMTYNTGFTYQTKFGCTTILFKWCNTLEFIIGIGPRHILISYKISCFLTLSILDNDFLKYDDEIIRSIIILRLFYELIRKIFIFFIKHNAMWSY